MSKRALGFPQEHPSAPKTKLERMVERNTQPRQSWEKGSARARALLKCMYLNYVLKRAT